MLHFSKIENRTGKFMKAPVRVQRGISKRDEYKPNNSTKMSEGFGCWIYALLRLIFFIKYARSIRKVLFGPVLMAEDGPCESIQFVENLVINT